MNKVESNKTHRVFLYFQGSGKLLWRGKLKKQLEVVSTEVAIENSWEKSQEKLFLYIC